MTDYQGVLICGELSEDKVSTITRELMNAGRRLSENLSQPLSLLLRGRNISDAAQEGIFLGADKVYTASGPAFFETSPENYLVPIMEACEQSKPLIIIFGHTDMGRDIAPRLAAKMETTICMDCVELAIDPDTQSLQQSKPVYGGNAIAVWTSINYVPQIVTMRPRVSSPAELDSPRKGEVISVVYKDDDTTVKSKLLETVKEEVKGIKLEEAKIIVAGGGGIGGSEGFDLIQELARVLRGTVGISRVPCDEGWMPVGLEIGQTGHMVSPDVYLAVGISGAPQHLAGCSNSKHIIAINKDPDANIFKEADLGLIGDYREILPALIDKIKELLSD